MSSIGWGDESPEVDQDLDLFYVLATVLGEDEMIPLDPTNNSPLTAHTRLILFRDQPIRDIVDRVTIFRDLEPVQVSTILINLALYVEQVHSEFEDKSLFQDIAQLLIKITKYTAEWDHHHLQKQKEHAQQLKHAQERQQLQHQQFLQNHLLTRPQALHRVSDPVVTGKTSTMVSTTSATHTLPQQSQQQQPQPQQNRQQKQKQSSKQKTEHEQSTQQAPERSTDNVTTDQLASAPRPQSASDGDVGLQRRNTVTSISLSTPTTPSVPPSNAQEAHGQPPVQQSTIPSTVTSETPLPPSSFDRRKFPLNNGNRMSSDLENSHGAFARIKFSRQDSTFGGSEASTSTHQNQQSKPSTTRKSPPSSVQHWTYGNAVLGMCSCLMIQNPVEGHQLIPAVKQVLRQALYRDRISANALVRLVTAYCYMAELDFSLPLENVFGEFLVEELRASTHGTHHGRNDGDDDSDDNKEGEDEEREKHLSQSKRNSRAIEKEKDKGTTSGGSGGGGSHGTGTRMLASNFHLLYHVSWIHHQAHGQKGVAAHGPRRTGHKPHASCLTCP